MRVIAIFMDTVDVANANTCVIALRVYDSVDQQQQKLMLQWLRGLVPAVSSGRCTRLQMTEKEINLMDRGGCMKLKVDCTSLE